MNTFTNVQTNGEAYNLTHTQEIYWSLIIETLTSLMGKQANIKNVDLETMQSLGITTSRKFFPYHDVSYLMDSSKLEKHGIPKPTTTLEEGLKTVLTWYSKYGGVITDPHMIQLKL